MHIPSEEELLAAACHIGHRAFKWNPKVKPYLYGKQKGVHIFDLTQTREHLEEACKQLVDLNKAGKTILFVSTKQHSTRFLEELGKETGHPVVTKKWIPGLLTNWKTPQDQVLPGSPAIVPNRRSREVHEERADAAQEEARQAR